MAEIIEIKASSIEETKKRAVRVLNISEEQIIDIKEKVKSKSFFGFFLKEGIYDVEYTLEKIKKENKIDNRHIARDLRKEKLENNKMKKKSIETEKISVENLEAKVIKNIEMDNEKLDNILLLIKTLIKKMNLKLNVNFLKINGKNYVINLSGEDQGIIIGKKGKTLNSFEYLLNSLLKDTRVSVDVEGFKEKRNETLIELANKMALKAIKTKKIVRLNPMPPRERKIIHEIINQYSELDTFSEGRDPKRYIVIKRKK